ncbi:MAG: glycosyltransferase [Erysipelotrichaceae bacterium]
MILVTLGSQDKQFVRLLDDVNRQIELKNIEEEVVVQAGYTVYNNDKMKIFDLIDHDSFNDLIEKCDLLITHGGAGSILNGIKRGKVVIGCPRLAQFNEHINDHQKQLVNLFSQKGYILKYDLGDDLAEVLQKAKSFVGKDFVSNTDNMIEIIENYIDNN